MTYKQVMAELKKLGTAQNRKIYKNHGGGANFFGVSFAHINKLQKKLKTNHDLALELWGSGNMDARILALLIADGAKLTKKEAEQMVSEIDFHMVGYYIGKLVSKSPHRHALVKKWIKSKKEYVRSAGYSTLCTMLRDGVDDLSSADAKKLLKTIEKEIHGSANRARYSMNNAVIALGTYKDDVVDDAVATAKRIGEVYVDHLKTNCKTPEAVSYIKKARVHLKKKAAKNKKK